MSNYEIGEKGKIALVVISYFVISISMVLMNKYLLSSAESIPAPFFDTWYMHSGYLTPRFQCVLTSLICQQLGRLGKDSDERTSV